MSWDLSDVCFQAFTSWKQNHSQRIEVERRYKDSWHNYLGVIVTSWAQWAAGKYQEEIPYSLIAPFYNSTELNTHAHIEFGVTLQ